jgi:predicted Zn finger-like uncharacterized protein
MILQCPQCDARFLVKSDMIPPEGREVRCAKCAHVWHATPPEEETPPPAPEDNLPDETADAQTQTTETDDAAQAPAAEEEQVEYIDFGMADGAAPSRFDDEEDEEPAAAAVAPPTKLQGMKPMLVAATILFAITATITGLLAFRPTLQSPLGFFYDAIGASATDGLTLSDVTLRERPARNKKRYVVEGKIINLSAEPRRVPVLQVSIRDQNGDVVMSREYEADATLAPGESYPFKASNLDTAFVDRVDHLLVDLGNHTELMLREEP